LRQVPDGMKFVTRSGRIAGGASGVGIWPLGQGNLSQSCYGYTRE
jgi:hypothetical protein